MFNRYELKMMHEVLVKDYRDEYVRRKTQGLSQDTIHAQLGGMIDLINKIKKQLDSKA